MPAMGGCLGSDPECRARQHARQERAYLASEERKHLTAAICCAIMFPC